MPDWAEGKKKTDIVPMYLQTLPFRWHCSKIVAPSGCSCCDYNHSGLQHCMIMHIEASLGQPD